MLKKIAFISLFSVFVLTCSLVFAQSSDKNPTPGRLERTTAFFHEKDGLKKANKSYPEWYRGKGKADLQIKIRFIIM